MKTKCDSLYKIMIQFVTKSNDSNNFLQIIYFMRKHLKNSENPRRNFFIILYHMKTKSDKIPAQSSSAHQWCLNYRWYGVRIELAVGSLTYPKQSGVPILGRRGFNPSWARGLNPWIMVYPITGSLNPGPHNWTSFHIL